MTANIINLTISVSRTYYSVGHTFASMGKQPVITVPTTVYEKAQEIAVERDMSLKEAVRFMCREGTYDV